VALFNLLCPFKLESALSLNPLGEKAVSEDIDLGRNLTPAFAISASLESIGDFLNGGHGTVIAAMDKNPDGSWHVTEAFHKQVWFTVFRLYIWPVGAAFMLLHGVFAYWRLKRRVRFAVRSSDGVYETDRINSPFVLGFISPRIYLPSGIGQPHREHVINHEQTHIRRNDCIVAAVAYATLAIHWFNPLVWAAYYLMLHDMESSCDEAVLRDSNTDIRRDYSLALLSVASNQKRLPIPLAFGEAGVKQRVVDVLRFRKPERAVVAVAAIAAIALAIGLSVKPENGNISSALERAEQASPQETSAPYSIEFQTELSVKTAPDRYSRLMSSVPGIHLGIEGQFEEASNIRYEAESGAFVLWEGATVTSLGNSAERPLSETGSVYWTPDSATKDGDAVAVSVVNGIGEIPVQETMAVDIQDYWYSLMPTSKALAPRGN
jgi:beta-lactamase regulating signal transducer with metallopeptidase domain